MSTAPKVVLTGDVALELIAPYFRAAGYDVPAADVPLAAAKPDWVYDVTSHEATLAAEVEGFYDPRFEKLAGCRFSRAGIAAIVDEFKWETLRAPKKVLALDADNTLWRGILSEDGPDALEPYADFQRGLLALRDAGVVLALLSKNDPFEFRSDMPLSNAAFAAVRTNWAPKAGNLLEACEALGLAPDAVVFVDDNPHERAQMAAHLPAVTVAPFPADLARPAQFLRRLREYFFADAGVTHEDRLRAADYRANALRATFADYLEGLGLTVRASRATAVDLDRLAQMAGKTNQFNATTIRRTREEFAALLDDPAKAVWTFRAADRFGEQGLVCYVVADRATRHVTDFVMSCRALGRTLEHFAYAYVVRQLGYVPEVDFTKTAKNRPFEDFWRGRDVRARTYYREVE